MPNPDTETKWIIDPDALMRMDNKRLLDEFGKLAASGKQFLKPRYWHGYKGVDTAILERMNPEFDKAHPVCIVCDKQIQVGEVFHQGLLHKDCVGKLEKPESDESEIKQLQGEVKEIGLSILSVLSAIRQEIIEQKKGN